MDNLGWDITTVIRNDATIQQGLWSSQYDKFSEANIDCSSITSGRRELDGSLFTSTLDLQGIQVCDQLNSSCIRVNEMLQKLVPNLDLDLDLIPRQELVRMATNSVLSSGITTWEDPLHSQLCSFPSSMICPVNATPGILPKNYEVLSEELDAFGDIRNDEGGVLLSSIFSRGENIQTLSCSGAYNVSSGGSESPSSNWKDTASQASSNPDSIWGQSLECKRKLEDYSNQHPCNVLQSSSSTSGSGFQFNFEDPSRSKKPRLENPSGCSSINFQPGNAYKPDAEAIAQVKDMIYRAAALRPLISLGVEEVVEKPRRKNVRISSDPQTVAARQRRERISDRLRVLQKLVPGGSKMDTASMLDEAANYLKFLKSQVGAMETLGSKDSSTSTSLYPTHFTQSFPMQGALFIPPQP